MTTSNEVRRRPGHFTGFLKCLFRWAPDCPDSLRGWTRADFPCYTEHHIRHSDRSGRINYDRSGIPPLSREGCALVAGDLFVVWQCFHPHCREHYGNAAHVAMLTGRSEEDCQRIINDVRKLMHPLAPGEFADLVHEALEKDRDPRLASLRRFLNKEAMRNEGREPRDWELEA